MPAGTPIYRHWVLVLRNGAVVIDWGGDQFMDINSGDLHICSENEISHHIQDSELDYLKSTGRVSAFDSHLVYFTGLPDRPLPTLD